MSPETIAKEIQSPPPTPSAELRHLDVCVGTWPTEGVSYGLGQSKENPYDSSIRWSGVESYEWLPGGFFLIRRFDAQIGGMPLHGIETIGYDAVSQSYPSHTFDNYGRVHFAQRTIRDGVWFYTGAEYCATYTFRNDGRAMAAHWEWLSEEDWLLLLDSEAVKVD